MTRYATVPSPCPSRADVIDTHAAWADTLQLHSRATPIEIEPVPPAGPNEAVELVTLGWHRTVDGDVTFVAVELPHPLASTIAATAVANC